MPLVQGVAFHITKLARWRQRGFLLALVLLPFWVSELVRIYGWMILLRESEVINHSLLRLGLVQQPVEMLYTDATMIMGLVHISMLFMVVPLVSVLDSLDDSLFEAACDLGAGLSSGNRCQPRLGRECVRRRGILVRHPLVFRGESFPPWACPR